MKTVAIIGAGAAGIFCASRLADTNAEIHVFESTQKPLQKLLLTGGGRCNFTNRKLDTSDPREFYPRGGNRLRKAFGKFGAKNTIDYFQTLGISAKEEDAGRIFPTSDDARDVARALLYAARNAKFHFGESVKNLKKDGEKLVIQTSTGNRFETDVVLFSTGGAWDAELKKSLEDLQIRFEKAYPSLFAITLEEALSPTWEKLSGISLNDVQLTFVGDAKNKAFGRGEFLFTHFGISGPATLAFSSRAARELAKLDYKAEIKIDFLPSETLESVTTQLTKIKLSSAKMKIKNANPFAFAQSAWENAILARAELDLEKTWANFSKQDEKKLLQTLKLSSVHATARAPHKGEFVTCGGVALEEIDFATMSAKKHQNIFFAGECLDIDAITGGYNLQAAWTTAKFAADAIRTKLGL